MRTPLGTIVAYGVEQPRALAPGDVRLAGIALELPWRAGTVRRLRDLDVHPAYVAESGSRTTLMPAPGSVPGVLASDPYQAGVWEATGTLDFLRVVESGDARSPQSPVVIARTGTADGPRWRVAPKGTVETEERIETRALGGDWEEAGLTRYDDAQPARLEYRRLRVVSSTPFALQSSPTNTVKVREPGSGDLPMTVNFDFATALAARTSRSSRPAISRVVQEGAPR